MNIFKTIMFLLLCSSLALAQLVNQRPIHSSAELLTEIKLAKRLTVVAPKLSSELMNKFFFSARDYEAAILVLDPEGFKAIDRYCHVIRFNYYKSVYVLPKLPQDGLIRVDRTTGTSLIQGPLVLGLPGVTNLFEGEPMVKNMAIQTIDPLLEKATFKYAC